MHNTPDDLSLTDFARYIRTTLKYFYILFLGLFQTLFRHALVIISVVLIVGAAGYFTGQPASQHYEGRMTCLHNALHKKMYGEMIDLLNTLVHNRQTADIAQLLTIDEAVASQILSVSATNIAGSKLSEDLSTEKLPFYLSFTMQSPVHHSALSAGLIYYLQHNQYNEAHRKITLDHAADKIKFLDHQLGILDSMKHAYMHYMANGRNVSSEPVDLKMSDLFKESRDLFQQRQDNEWTSRYDNSVEVIYTSAPLIIQSPSTQWKRGILAALAAGIALSVIFYFIDLSKKSE